MELGVRGDQGAFFWGDRVASQDTAINSKRSPKIPTIRGGANKIEVGVVWTCLAYSILGTQKGTLI